MEHVTDAGTPREFEVATEQEGLRLDKALEALLPGAGLRQRRRLIEGGRVLVGGRPAPAGLKLRLGQRLTILPEAAEAQARHDAPAVTIVAATADYAALYKPAGLHSATLAGGGGQSLEALLPGLFPRKNPRLLNRLDLLTTGLVLAALNTRAAKVFAAIPAKDMLKEYLAVVEGVLTEPLTLKRTLDTEDRKRTRVLGKLDSAAANWTLVFPHKALAGGRTLVRARIQSGARHQIRAHLAAADLPIVGDPLYGSGEGAVLFLHHARLEFPGFKARCDPHWLRGLRPASGMPTENDDIAAGQAPA
jgi:23S rRNA pseudouridine1911/1915/1917 synthase